MKNIGKYKIPKYAITAIEYGDFSGLYDEDIDNINEFLEYLFPNGFVVDCTSTRRRVSRITPVIHLSECLQKLWTQTSTSYEQN